MSGLEDEKPEGLSSGSEEDSAFAEAESSSNESDGIVELETKTSPSQSQLASPRKRRRNTDGFSNTPRLKRLRGLYNASYRSLFNDAITELDDDHFSGGGRPNLLPTQLGLSAWSVKEKISFFSALGRLGRDDLPGIAAAVGTKSMQEVRQFILLLKTGLVELNLNTFNRGPINFAEIPAAVELSEPCCNLLNDAAEALAWHQEKWEASQEQLKHGTSWLLSFDSVAGLEGEGVSDAENEDIDEEKDGDQSDEEADSEEQSDSEQPLSAMTVLKPSSWLDLSARIFMNPADTKNYDNWRDVADPGQLPGIYRTAFEDFYTLTLMITQRVVQASLFQAMSRLRARDHLNTSRGRKPYVRRGDVRTALTILGMKHDSRDYWRRVPRRCHLQIYDGKVRANKREIKSRIIPSYDEVERLLGDGLEPPDEQHPAIHPGASLEKDNDSGPDSDGANSDDGIDPMPGLPTDPEEQLHEYADVLDKHASVAAEQQLWELLEAEPPPGLLATPEKPPRKPTVQKKTASELRDWRDNTEYESFWETTAQDPIEAFMDENASERSSPAAEEAATTWRSRKAVDLPFRAEKRAKKHRTANRTPKQQRSSGSDEEEGQAGPSMEARTPRSSAPRRAKDVATAQLETMAVPVPDDSSVEGDYVPMEEQ